MSDRFDWRSPRTYRLSTTLAEEHADENRVLPGDSIDCRRGSKNIWAHWYTGGITEERHIRRPCPVLAWRLDLDEALFCIGLPMTFACRSACGCADGKLHLYLVSSHQSGHTATNPAGDAPVGPPQVRLPGVVRKAIVDSQGRWLIPTSVWMSITEQIDRSPASTGAWCVVSEDSVNICNSAVLQRRARLL